LFEEDDTKITRKIYRPDLQLNECLGWKLAGVLDIFMLKPYDHVFVRSEGSYIFGIVKSVRAKPYGSTTPSVLIDVGNQREEIILDAFEDGSNEYNIVLFASPEVHEERKGGLKTMVIPCEEKESRQEILSSLTRPQSTTKTLNLGMKLMGLDDYKNVMEGDYVFVCRSDSSYSLGRLQMVDGILKIVVAETQDGGIFVRSFFEYIPCFQRWKNFMYYVLIFGASHMNVRASEIRVIDVDR